MGNQHNRVVNQKLPIIRIVVGTMAAILVSLIGAFAIAVVMNREIIGEKGVSLAVYLILFLSSFAGSAVSVVKERRYWLPTISVSIALYLIVLLCMKVVLFDTAFCGVGKGIAAVLTGALPILALYLKPKNTKKAKFKYRPI